MWSLTTHKKKQDRGSVLSQSHTDKHGYNAHTRLIHVCTLLYTDYTTISVETNQKHENSCIGMGVKGQVV